MSGETDRPVELQIGHILFLDIVGYSKLASNEQRRQLEVLNQIVRRAEPFRSAEAAEKLIRLPTGDGMALAFFTSPDAPVRCAAAISKEAKAHPELNIRMGVHSGPVDVVYDVNDRPNITGAGINMSQRVMDCADAGHILLSKRAADDLAQYEEWKPQLHDLGEMEVKHGVRVPVVNFYNHDVGNSATPSKLVQAEEARRSAAQAAARRKRRQILVAGSLLGVFTLLTAAGIWAWQRRVALVSAYKTGAAGIVEKSIAVLPFDNFEDKENAYVADGVQDDILTDLTKVADLKVISRRSVAQYRDTKATIHEIGQALQVANVLQGTVRKVAGRIHVTAQLIDTRSEAQTWAEKYDGDVENVLEIQNEISQAIVSQLKAALSPAEKAAIEEKPTQDKQAYDLYLRARALVYDQFGVLGKTIGENAENAIPLLESAIARDPKFTLAYCALADAHLTVGAAASRGVLDNAPLAKAKAAIDAALRISPNFPEAHLTLARYLLSLENASSADRELAEKELSIAEAGLPGRVDIFDLRAGIEEQRGKWKEALRDREKAVALDPRNAETAFSLANLYLWLRQYPDAESLADQAVATMPRQTTAMFWRLKSRIALARGDTKTALAALDSSPSRNSGLSGMNILVAEVFVLQRDYLKAEAILQSIEETEKTHNVVPKTGFLPFHRGVALLQLGKIARFRGDKEKAGGYFEAARVAFEESLARHPENDLTRGYIAEINAAVGRKEDAIREARQAVEPGRDHLAEFVPGAATSLAIVYMWTGERDAALQQLAATAALGGSGWCGFTAGDLKLNPIWDELRNDPRFTAIVAEATKPVRIE